MAHSEVERLMDDSVKTAVEVVARRFVTSVVEDTIKDAYSAGHGTMNKRRYQDTDSKHGGRRVN